ncbi:hypothetical protein Tco_1568252 [Tanacetum coccineum]
MSSPNHSTSNIEDAFSSMNILNYISVSSDYFSASAGSRSFNSSENSNDNMIPPTFSSFYNNTYLKDVQAFYAKELPISSPNPVTPPVILTLSPILPPSLLFNPRYFFIPEKLLPPKKRIHSPSSSSTTLSNSSRNQTCNLVSPSSSVSTPTPPQVFEIGKYELHLHRIERMEEGRINGNKLKTELKGIRTQIIRLQKERMPPKRTSTSETPAITLAAIQQLINDGISSALKAQAASMASDSNPNRNPEPTRFLCSKMESIMSSLSCNFLLQCHYAEENKVTYATGTLTDDALSWWNSYAQPIRINSAIKSLGLMKRL